MSTTQRVFVGAVFGATLALVAGCALTAWVAYRTASDANRVSASQFRRNAVQLRLAITDRLTIPVYGMEGLRSAVTMLRRPPDAAEFRRAVLALDTPRDDPGVYGFGYIERVRRDQLPAFLAAARADYGGAFELTTRGHADDLWIIRSIEPLERNRPALGYDIGSDTVRREAAERMLRTRALATTAPIQLLQAAPDEASALYLLPVFSDGTPRHEPADNLLLGAVYAAVDYQRMLQPLDQANTLLDFTLLDMGTTEGNQRVYPADRSGFSTVERGARFTRTVDIRIGSRPFRLHMVSTPEFDRVVAITRSQTRRVVAMGAAASVLMAVVAWLLIAGRRRALDLAQSLTVELDRLATVARLTSDSVAIVDARGQVVWVNPGFTRLTGHAEDAARGRPLLSLLGTDADQHTAAQVLAGVLSDGTAYRGEVTIGDRHGKRLWTELEIQPVPGRRGRPASFIVIQSNISERRAMEQALRESRAFLQRTGSVAGVGGWQIELPSQRLIWSEQTRRIYEVPDDYQPTCDGQLDFFADDARAALQAALAEARATGKGWDLELPMLTWRKRPIWIRSTCEAEFDNDRPARLIGSCQDVSKRKLAEIALEENGELLRVTLNSIGDAVVTTAVDRRVTWMNPIAEALSGWTAGEAEGLPVSQVLNLVSEETRHPITNPVLIALRESRIVDLSLNTVMVSRDGTEYGIEDSAAPIRDAGGRVIGAVMVFHDVTAARALNRQISHQARHDALTGVANRIEFEQRLARFLRRVQHSNETGAVMFVDLDHFKLVNDTLGHYAGDELLCQIAALLQASVRRHDTVARLGGDEFAVLLENCNRADAEQIAQTMCDTIDRYRYVSHAGQPLRVGASIGIMPVEPPWRDQHEVLRAADISCYIAKDQGRNRFHTWQPEDESPQSRFGESAWGARIETALDQRRFQLYAQRIGPTSPRAIREGGLHCEVLLRMRGPDDELIAAGAFMPAAERYQLVSRIDRWVLQEVFDKLKDVAGSAAMPRMLAINLSGQSVGDRTFHDFVHGLIARAGFDVRLICFEVTETAAITNLAEASLFLRSVRASGIRIAMDDFGAGMSSFGYLKQLSVDYLKIDGQFVQGLGKDPLDLVSVRSFCGVAEALGIQTIAEYVETTGQLEILRELGVDYAQGFLLHRPEPLADLLSLPLPSDQLP